MKSIHASTLISTTIWNDFIAHFKSDTTKASYEADIDEIMNAYEKDFLQIRNADVEQYFELLASKVKTGVLRSATMSKKFRELHSFAEYICDNRDRYGIDDAYMDYYYPYLKLTAKQEQYVRSVPAEEMDRLFQAAEESLPTYCMLTFMYRVGISSTELTELKPGDFAIYENGMYAVISGREEMIFVPEDVAEILQRYMNERQDYEYLFYNRNGRKLNTMYISRMMKKYTQKAGIPSYSAQSIRNTCGVVMYAYGANSKQVARQFGTTETQIKRYKNTVYRENMLKNANNLVKLRILPPED